MVTLNDYLYSGDTIFKIIQNYMTDLRKEAKRTHNEIDLVHSNCLLQVQEMLEHNDFLTSQSQKIREFYKYMAKEFPFLAFTFRGRIKSLIRTEEKFNGYIVEYIYNYYEEHGTYASIRYEIDELINFYNCLGYKIQRINRHIELKDSSSKKYGGIIFIIPDDIDETIGWTCLCHALGKRGIVYSHVPRQYVWNWLELHSNKEIIWTQNKIIILPRKKYCKKSELSIVAFQNSKIASDQQPILAVWGSCFYNKVRITDKKFFNRYDYISELKKLGWHGEVDKESAWIEYRGRINSTEEPLLIANNLRSGFAVMMGILINREKAELLRFEQLKRGYSQLQNNLESIGVMYNVEDIPKSESVAVILQRKDGRYYVQQRDSNAVKNPEKITLFGGHVESGELPDQAIKRELQEELELEINCELIEVFQVSKPLFSTSGLIYLYCARNIGDLKICHEGKILLLDRQKICEQDTSFFLRCILGMRFI